MSYNPRHKNGHRRRQLRARFKAMGLPCAICGRPIHYDEPSDSKHPLSFVIDERVPVSRWREGGFNNPTQAALDPGNVQPVHWICNVQKGTKTMGELRAIGMCQKKHPYNGTGQTLHAINIPDGKW